jgi:hypothetical protein
MATFEQIIDGDALAEGNPFTYLKVEGEYEFTNPNTLLLEGDGVIFVNEDHGRLHLIVKPNREVDLRIKAKQRNLFDGIEDYPAGAFDAKASKPFFGNESSLDITLRGGSMMALVATDKGDQGVWDKSGSTFHLETVQRDITQPDGDFGILFSLTAPNGDYADSETYSLIWEADGPDFEVSIRDIRYSPDGGYTAGLTDFETTDEEFVYDDSTFGRFPYSRIVALTPYSRGKDADGRDFVVEIGQGDDGLFYVVVDDAVDTIGFDMRSKANNAAALKTDALRRRTTLIDRADGFGFELALGGLAIGAFIIAFLIGRRS